MMATRSLNVVISGDATKLKGAFTQAGDHAEKFGRKTEEASHRAAESFKHVHEASKLLLEIGGLSSLAFGLKDVTEEAVKAETEQKKLEATVKTAGLSWKAHGKEIDEWLDKTSRASGFVKSDLTSSLSNLIRVTGSVSKARKLESEAMDVSRARGTSLASAQQLLARVYAGSFTSLQRLGIPVKAVTAAQDKLRETTKNATADQIAHAKAVDKQATVTKALGLVQDKFGGQSKAFASSTAGSFQRAKASLDLFEEGVGKVVLPIMAKAANAIANVATVVSEKWPAIEKTIAAVVAVVKAKITDWITKNRGDINSVIKAFMTFGEAVKTVFEKVALPIIKRTVAAIGPFLSGLVDVIRGVVRLVSGLLSGDWSKAWSGAKEAVGGAFKAIKTVVVTALANLWTILKGVGPTVIKLIVKGLENLGKALATGIYNGVKAAVKAIPGMIGGLLKGIGHTITHGISSAVGALNPFGDGLGKTGRLDATEPRCVPRGGLHGARPSMGPFAAIGARFGLHVSSGRDDHSVMTSSGNVSYHSTGEAIDEAGSPAGMMGYFRYLKSHFGGRLAELIYGPGQVGIKDGRPFNFGPATNAQHMDHVHVAFDYGRPGCRRRPRRVRLHRLRAAVGRHPGHGRDRDRREPQERPARLWRRGRPERHQARHEAEDQPEPVRLFGRVHRVRYGRRDQGQATRLLRLARPGIPERWGRRTVSVQTATGSTGRAARAVALRGHGSSGGAVQSAQLRPGDSEPEHGGRGVRDRSAVGDEGSSASQEGPDGAGRLPRVAGPGRCRCRPGADRFQQRAGAGAEATSRRPSTRRQRSRPACRTRRTSSSRRCSPT
jgi:hypothetical protein